MQKASWSKKPEALRFRDAWHALMGLRQNPDDTEKVFELIRALSGACGRRAFQRFQATPQGRQILDEKRDLIDVLSDREALARMPKGSLGRRYFEFTEQEQIRPGELIEASEQTPTDPEIPEDGRRFFERLREMHDLEHVVTGYGRDLRGEVSVLTLDVSQQWHHGIAAIVALVLIEGSNLERRMIWNAWRRGRKAAWLYSADWEGLLPRPLEEVRMELRLGEPPVYEPLRSEGAPALG